MKPAAPEGRFIGEPGARIFVLRRPAVGARRGCVLVVPAFAEEMNKSRRMLADAGAALAHRGFDVVVPDLFGTGDSAGDFGEADCARWRRDLQATVAWCAATGSPVTRLLAVRLGCGLAADALAGGALPPVEASVLWQPVFDGERYLNQFLRLRVAASMMLDGDRRESVTQLREQFAAGRPVEVAGYAVSAALAAGLDALRPPAGVPAGFGRTHWLEVTPVADAALSPASQRLVDAQRAAGGAVHAGTHAGEPFWSSTEIVRIPSLVEATVQALAAEGA